MNSLMKRKMYLANKNRSNNIPQMKTIYDDNKDKIHEFNVNNILVCDNNLIRKAKFDCEIKKKLNTGKTESDNCTYLSSLRKFGSFDNNQIHLTNFNEKEITTKFCKTNRSNFNNKCLNPPHSSNKNAINFSKIKFSNPLLNNMLFNINREESNKYMKTDFKTILPKIKFDILSPVYDLKCIK